MDGDTDPSWSYDCAPIEPPVFLVRFNQCPGLDGSTEKALHWALFVPLDAAASELNENSHGALFHLVTLNGSRRTDFRLVYYWDKHKFPVDRVHKFHHVGKVCSNFSFSNDYAIKWFDELRTLLNGVYLDMVRDHGPPSGPAHRLGSDGNTTPIEDQGTSEVAAKRMWDGTLNCQTCSQKMLEKLGLRLPAGLEPVHPFIIDFAVWSTDSIRSLSESSSSSNSRFTSPQSSRVSTPAPLKKTENLISGSTDDFEKPLN